ncbi:hypothetical protein [Micromonospora sp. Llam0]|uniref:hypothetical protein n=1 Tax=Micromonospora sp. Llam0 TaxID=2485143 RepID=UPI001F36DC52|nr:hypothetical protein [Micromonospora sp. Llam0]
MTTFRLRRQTSRSSRFAEVTVEVSPSSTPEVEVTTTAGANAEHRREADLGARWALRHNSPAVKVKVTVTSVVTTEIDTGTGDVYEATTHAVWQALGVEHSASYVGFSDPLMVTSWLNDIAGRQLDAVTEARYWYEGRREPDAASLLHAWLHFERAEPIGLHGRGDEFLLDREDPYLSYEMGDDGETRVGPAFPPDVLSGFVGAMLTDGAVITGSDGELTCTGLVLRFDVGDLVIGTLGDEWVLAAGPVPAAVAPCWTVHPFIRDAAR